VGGIVLSLGQLCGLMGWWDRIRIHIVLFFLERGLRGQLQYDLRELVRDPDVRLVIVGSTV
jgi:hypothetical protein